MDQSTQVRRTYRFGVFQADLATGELHRQGIRVKLQDQPFQVLVMLLERPGDLVTREEISKKLWGEDTFVDFDHSLNISINKLREALGDSASIPRFIETVPRRGYRFLAPVQVHPPEPSPQPPQQPTTVTARATAAPEAPSAAPPKRPPRQSLWLAAGLAVLLTAGFVGYLIRRSPATAPATEGPTRLVVLPFEDLTGVPGQEYFIAGLHEELIAQLGRVHPRSLNLIARASAAQYAGTHKSVREIGRDLNVNYVLDGSVRRNGDRYHITTGLIRVSDQTQVRSDSYDLDMGEMLSLQMGVAHRVADALSVEFPEAAQKQIQLASTTSAEAYDAYLRGRALWYQETEPSLHAAIKEFELAIRSDPNYVPAYVGLADTYNVLGGYGLVPPPEAFPKGKAAAEKALQLSPDFSDAYSSIGFAQFYYDWDWTAAEESFRKALSLNPNNQQAHFFYGSFLHATGRLQESEAQNKIGLELDPKSSWGYDDHGWMLLSQHKPMEAIAEFQKALALDPKFAAGHLSLAMAYARNRQFQEAISETQKAEELHGDPTRILEVRGTAQALSGDIKGAESTLDKMLKNQIGGHVSPYSVALIYTSLGYKDKAIDWLEKGYREKEPWLPWIRVLVEWDSLRSEPRFIDLMHRMNL